MPLLRERISAPKDNSDVLLNKMPMGREVGIYA